MKSYNTLLEAISGLRDEGYQEDFNLKPDFLECRDGIFRVFEDEFEVDKYFRFDVDTDPSDQSIVYAISSFKLRLRGILVNSYSIYSEGYASTLIDKLRFRPHSV